MQNALTIDVFAYCSVCQQIHSVQGVDGSNCSFTGALPDAVFQGVWLDHIDLSGNELSGSISNTLTSFAMRVSILFRPETYNVKLLYACLLQ